MPDQFFTLPTLWFPVVNEKSWARGRAGSRGAQAAVARLYKGPAAKGACIAEEEKEDAAAGC